MDQTRRSGIYWTREEGEVSTGLEKKERYLLDQTRRSGIYWTRQEEVVSTGLDKKRMDIHSIQIINAEDNPMYVYFLILSLNLNSKHYV